MAFIDRCIATVRSWREYVVSTRRVRAMQEQGGAPAEDGLLPPGLEWWCSNYALLRDLAIRGYPVHVVSYDSLLRDPQRVATEVLSWLGRGDAEQAAAIVRPGLRTASVQDETSDAQLAEGIEPRHLEIFDTLHETIDAERPLTQSFIDRLNQTDTELRPMVLEHQAGADAKTIADVLGRE